ncbi:MAG TPA: metal-dependent hydrolase [Burkholderiales bacterium]|nr:metal-dependent hydrolase [Burkholderiales bacterium]
MDTLTHALSGALLGRATAPREPGPNALATGRRMVVGAAAAAFPDLDFVTSYLSPLAYLHHHRGITHSVLMLPLWALLIALLFAALWRWKPGWRAYYGIAAAGLAAHIAGDLITAFGTMVFAPISDARYALSATFIIDLWFTGIILAGLATCAVWRSSRAPAIAGLAVLAAYVGFQLVVQQRAIDFGEQYANANGMQQAKVTAMPRPVSPFNWTVFVEADGAYHYAHVNLIRKTAPPQPGANAGFIERLDAAYGPLTDAVWIRAERYGSSTEEVALAREAFRQPDFRFFRWFASYPALLRADTTESCAWFYDLRFSTPGRDNTPFRYGMCRTYGAWRPFQLLGDVRRPVY